ncbi:MAG: hypothetical protein A49_04610 [Methyloceanibacter sp.]|nr:MAG: hypothetical protein A49_04610 [Methyloceanibacter sp.]
MIRAAARLPECLNGGFFTRRERDYPQRTQRHAEEGTEGQRDGGTKGLIRAAARLPECLNGGFHPPREKLSAEDAEDAELRRGAGEARS